VSSYDAAAEAWAAGPAYVYARLGEAMLDHSPVALAGAAVLDVGAGTAVVADAALRRGARRAVATDVSLEMLRRRSPTIPAVVGDAVRLPFADRAFDLVAAGFCLSHLDDPAAALTEWQRVAGAVVTSAFAPGPPHPAKVAVDEAMERLGFVPPRWYARMKKDSESIEDPAVLEALLRAAGFASVRVHERTVDAGLDSPDDVVRWRFGMAHLAPWVAGLSDTQRREASEAARGAVADLGPVTIGVLAAAGR
jgi:demethylmenaquinone methyltransferase/2-methoxy-6-polyprenyl-1,4-benzoquinol methylase